MLEEVERDKVVYSEPTKKEFWVGGSVTFNTILEKQTFTIGEDLPVIVEIDAVNTTNSFNVLGTLKGFLDR